MLDQLLGILLIAGSVALLVGAFVLANIVCRPDDE